MPYVKEKGSAGDLVSDEQTIYATKACMSIVRKSKSATEEETATLAKVSWANMEEIIEAKTSVTASSSLLGSAVDVPEKIAKSSAEEQRKTAITEAINEQVAGGATQTPSTQADEVKQIEESIEKLKNGKLYKASQAIENITYKGVVTKDFSEWCDMLITYLDELPDMDELTEYVYEVEKNDGIWSYTGNYLERDSWANAEINKVKRSICSHLSVLMDDVTETMTAKLEDLTTRVEKVGPFMTVISAIKSAPSIDTIVSWAKSVIKFAVSLYELIYGVFKMAISLLEVIIVKFPQVISKITSIITKFECDLSQAKPVTVEIDLKKSETNSSDEDGNTVRKTK